MTAAPAVSRRPAPIGSAGSRRQYLVLLVVIAVLALAPFVLPADRQPVAVRTLIFALLAVSWNVMSGYGGMFSFGHAAFFGIGAYADAYLLVQHGISPWIGMVVGAIVAAAFGVLTAYASLRYKLAGAYFALATFAFAQMLLLLVSNMDSLRRTEGFNIPILPSASWSMIQFPQNDSRYYWIPLGLLALAVAVKIALVNSRAGQFVIAARDDATAAEALGIPVMRYRLLAVGISSAIAAVAGVYYVQYYLFVGPENAFGGSVSIEAIVPAVIGGIGTIWGPLVGAAIVGPLSELTSSLLRNPPGILQFLEGKAGLDVITYAVLLILIVVFLPRGVYGSIKARLRR
ncbi:MAG: branched-chain amino acid ABC transporter permease [Mycobacteriaceae bacterium]